MPLPIPRAAAGARPATALLLTLLAACGGGGDAPSDPATRAPDNPMPSVTGLTPQSQVQATGGLLLVVRGSSFVNGSLVRWNGQDRATEFVSSTALAATLVDGDLAVAGYAAVAVRSPAPGGGTSPSYPFIVSAKTAPTVAELQPASVAAGSPGAAVTILGGQFYSDTKVHVGSEPRPTEYVFPVRIRVTLAAADLATSGVLPLRVVTPGPGGGEVTVNLRIDTPSTAP